MLTTAKQGIQHRLRELAPSLLPFADVATDDLPLGRILRLSLFQVSVGMALVLITGTLNRVMIVELGVPAWFVAVMVALPVVFAPLRALIGHRSDTYISALGWRRVPFIWFGTLMQWGGLAILPFALLVLSGDGVGSVMWGQVGAGLAFLMIGLGLHTTQTAGLALASDLAPPDVRPRLVALLFVMLLVGMVFSALLFGWLLRDFEPLKLIRVIQSAAVISFILNMISMWKQEPRGMIRQQDAAAKASFSEALAELREDPRSRRLLLAVALGTIGFTMQDILLEPFGGQILGLSVSATTGLTALLAGGMLVAFVVAARWLAKGMDPHRLAAYGALQGIVAFALIGLVSVLKFKTLFAIGVVMIGIGGGLFAMGTLTAAMAISREHNRGLALGAWGAVQATATGVAIAAGGALRDIVSGLATEGALGPGLAGPGVGYAFVYHLEWVLLFGTLIVIGPLAAFSRKSDSDSEHRFGFAEFPN